MLEKLEQVVDLDLQGQGVGQGPLVQLENLVHQDLLDLLDLLVTVEKEVLLDLLVDRVSDIL